MPAQTVHAGPAPPARDTGTAQPRRKKLASEVVPGSIGGMTDHRFQVHLGGIITLLAQHLYARPEVFVRELVQNAHDAVRARYGLAAEEQGGITVEVLTASGDALPTLQVADNGAGLDEDDVHRFLATIGASSKRPDAGALPDPDLIGRFGIGLLSCFIVADEIVLHSRSVKPGAQAVCWHGRADGTYTITASASPAEPGTVVFLRAKPDAAAHLAPEAVAKALRTYAGLLRVPVHLVSGERRETVNAARPWRGVGTNADAIDRLRRAGETMLDDRFMDAIVLGDEQLGYEGAAFALAHAVSVARRQRHRVYVKDMFLADDVADLLPSWAFFLRAVVDSHRVQPTASRETLHDDADLEALKDSLDVQLRRALQRMATHERPRFLDLVEVHGDGLRHLAAEDGECCRLFAPWLSFPTTHGPLTLHAFRNRFGTLNYARTVDEFRQLAPLAKAQGLGLINGGFSYGDAILSLLPTVDTDYTSHRLGINEISGGFDDVPLDRRADATRIEQAAAKVLRGRHTRVEVRAFSPAELPALLHLSDEARLRRHLRSAGENTPPAFAGALDALSSRVTATAVMYLNWNHPLIPRLAQANLNEEGRAHALRLLHVHALQAGHHTLETDDLSVMGDALLRLVGTLAGDRP
jgi:molecular chaperone HtpG